MNTNDSLSQLNDFDLRVRQEALEGLVSAARRGDVKREQCRGWTNMHCHTFFSYNAYGYSPSRFAWEAWRRGLETAGIVDFDCLDGTEEFLHAGRLLRLKTCAGLETRVFVPEYADRVINSPNEPGVFYMSGAGFVEQPAPDSSPAACLDRMRRRASQRNTDMIAKINDCLGDVLIDYERDVLTMTPAGNATERHILIAYEKRARRRFPCARERAEFWAGKLGEPVEEIEQVIDDSPNLQAVMRNRLMKQGGPGYAEPDAGSFPDIGEVIDMIRQCGAMPSACWLDGASEGERDPRRHLEFLLGKGCESISVIPDRNWNVPAAQHEWKVRNLNALMDAGQSLDMIFLAGTEMNRDGNRFVDDFTSPALAPLLETFRRGALTAWGHTLLRMCAGVGITGEWSDAHFGTDRRTKNDFFARVGRAPYPSTGVMKTLRGMDANATPAEFLKVLSG